MSASYPLSGRGGSTGCPYLSQGVCTPRRLMSPLRGRKRTRGKRAGMIDEAEVSSPGTASPAKSQSGGDPRSLPRRIAADPLRWPWGGIADSEKVLHSPRATCPQLAAPKMRATKRGEL